MANLSEVQIWIESKVLPEIIKNKSLSSNVNDSASSGEESDELIKVQNISISFMGTEESFMLTKCYKVKIDYTYRNESRTRFLIAKRTPQDIPLKNYELVGFEQLFHNEILAYEKIIPALRQITKLNKFDCTFPTYFYSSQEKYLSTIVLGDFSIDGFKMTKSRINLSLEHLLLGVKNLGVFHGLGYVLKTIDRAKFDDFINQLQEARYETRLDTFTEISNAGVERFTKAVEKFYPQCPQKFLSRLQTLLADNFVYSKKRLEPTEPFATLCHGDYLRNNMAFAYGDEKDADIPTRVIMFDLQTVRYSSPMVDLCTFLTISAGRDVRVSQFDTIFDAYHQALVSTFLSHTNIDLPTFLTKSELHKEYTRYLPYSLGIASFFLRHLHEPIDIQTLNLLSDDCYEMQYVLTQGGDSVDAELASLVKELYELTVKYDVDIFEGFDV